MLAAGPFGLGPAELVIILVILVMLFGASRLADLGGALGKGIREFRHSVKEEDEEGEPPAEPPARASATATTVEMPSDLVSAVKCPSCGTLNPVGSRHCNQCGAGIAAPVS